MTLLASMSVYGALRLSLALMEWSYVAFYNCASEFFILLMTSSLNFYHNVCFELRFLGSFLSNLCLCDLFLSSANISLKDGTMSQQES